MHLGVPAEGFAHLADDPRSAGHVLHTSRDHEVGISDVQGPGGVDGGGHAGGTESVDGLAWYRVGQSGEKQGHPGDVAVVFSGLVRAPHQDIADVRLIEVGMAFEQGTQSVGSEVVRSNGGQGAAEVADGRPDAVDEERIHEAAGDVRSPARLRQKSRMGLKTKVWMRATSPLTRAYMRLPSWGISRPSKSYSSMMGAFQ